MKLKTYCIEQTEDRKEDNIFHNEMNKDVEFEVDEDATKAQIRSAFKKSLNKSKFNRKILSEFVELVA